MTAVLLQVRLDSKRLPNKALLKLKDLTLIEHSLRSLKEINADKFIVVTTYDSITKLRPLLNKWGWEYYLGPKENVLERFIGAIDKFKIKRVIRATGDNPLVSHELANILIKKHISDGNDYSGFLNNPLGTGVEVVESSSLRISYDSSESEYDREHVTPYIYNNRDKFRVYQGDAPDRFLFPGSRVTVDTPEDYNRIEKLFSQLYYGNIISLESVIKWLKKEL